MVVDSAVSASARRTDAYENDTPSKRIGPAGDAVTLPLSVTVSGAVSTGSSRAHAARPRSINDSTQPAANIGQISWPRYIVKAVSWPTVSSCRHTSQPPTDSVSTVAVVSVRPTAGS
jgi:hypothetical protein